jgi:hypothetical protein
MSVSSIFAKIDELERKIASLAHLASIGVQTAVPQPTSVPEDVLNRLAAVEEIVAAFAPPDIDSINSRLSVLEATKLPDDLPDKVAANLHEIGSVAEKVNHLETVTLPHIITRLENVESHVQAEP